MIFFWLLLAAIALSYGWYTLIIARYNRVLEALARLDVWLAWRYGVIAKLLSHDGALDTQHADALAETNALLHQASGGIGSRASASVRAYLEREAALQAALRPLMVMFENAPQALPPELQQEHAAYRKTTLNVQEAFDTYNRAAGALNAALSFPPGSWLGRLAGADRYPLAKY